MPLMKTHAGLVCLTLLVLVNGPARSADDSAASSNAQQTSREWAEIRAVDAATGAGVPLVEFETVNGLIFVTDNAGRVAFHEPGLMGREIFLTVRSHGYEHDKDVFGFPGAKVTPQPDKPIEIKVHRKIVAERLCRLTGEGLYRDSLLLGQKVPFSTSPARGMVVGQDSIQAAIYRDKLYCLWGDTARMEYPLGLFRTAGATIPWSTSNEKAIDPSHGLPYDYLTDPKSGFARAMIPLADRPEGVIWIDGLFVVPDENNVERMACHFSRRKGLVDELEHGIAIYNDAHGIFEPAQQLALDEHWRQPSTHPIVYTDNGRKYLLFGSPNPNVRVPATLSAVLDPNQYEALTCLKDESIGKSNELDLAADGRPNWRWQKTMHPVESKQERRWVKDGKLKPEFTRFLPADATSPADRIVLHSGTVRWNEFRQRWVLIACQIEGMPSHLGEVWYAQSNDPTGPFTTAVKIVTHDRQTFYNVCQHAFLDRDSGRTIHFEGTYTNDFSGNPYKTPRYNYNQVLYRLDLAADALTKAHVD